MWGMWQDRILALVNLSPSNIYIVQCVYLFVFASRLECHCIPSCQLSFHEMTWTKHAYALWSPEIPEKPSTAAQLHQCLFEGWYGVSSINCTDSTHCIKLFNYFLEWSRALANSLEYPLLPSFIPHCNAPGTDHMVLEPGLPEAFTK